MNISASDVKVLREQTGAGMMDCKRALIESQGDFDKAVIYLREKGLAAAKKRSGKITAEGLVVIKIDDNQKKATILEVNSETDFVAKNEQFKTFVNDVLDNIHQSHYNSVEELLSAKSFNSNHTVQELLSENIATIGENMSVRRFKTFAVNGEGSVGTYIHGNGRIGVLVNVKSDKSMVGNADYQTLVKDLCMHVAAAKPQYLVEQEVPPAVLEQEKSIYKAQLLEQGKPENVIDKIMGGKVAKFYSESCFLNQLFVKDDKKSITQVLAEFSKQHGCNLSIDAYVRWELGEGIEVNKSSFADEIAQLTK